jgi:aspartyl-tRNA(Asn)/glutamyl-tRNA(Gln) amidotransferase subunit A
MTISASEMLDCNIRELGTGFREGRWSPVDLTSAALERIAKTEPSICAWVLVDPDQAMAAAQKAERELRAGIDRGPLHGIPLGVKDIFDVVGWPTRCGSTSRRDAAPAIRDARSVATLREAGAVLLGKTVTQEFAAGVVSAPARNPWDPSRIPEGSSGGSAAAVAVGACLGALGSDTGGSIRIPAAACGVVGFKPSFGQVSVAGVFPLSVSLDTVGPLARCVDDAWILWNTLLEAQTIRDLHHQQEQRKLNGVRIGIPDTYFFEWLQPSVRDRLDVAIDALRSLAAAVVDVSWPLADAARAAAFIVNRVETAYVHERVARVDHERFQMYGADLRLRVVAGRSIPATLYLQALDALATTRASMERVIADYNLDALLAPTLPTTALPADNLTIDNTGLDESLGAAWTRLTMPFNATGQPVLALPVGFAADGLPIGLQLAGTAGHEVMLIQIGRSLEAELEVHSLRPPLLMVSEAPNQSAHSG